MAVRDISERNETMTIAEKKLAPGIDVNGTTNSLYENDISRINVVGPATQRTKDYVRSKYANAHVLTKNEMEKRGLIYSKYPTRIKIDYLTPDESGVVNGYTYGPKDGVNEGGVNGYIVPGTNEYRSFGRWLRTRGGSLGRHLFRKYGSFEAADDQVAYTSVHETNHDELQLKPIEKINGKSSKECFRDSLVKRLNSRYSANLPKWAKWLAPILTSITYVQALEGLNEVTTEQIYNGESTNGVIEKSRDSPTSYGKYKTAAASALRKIGFEKSMDANYTGMDFYNDFVDNPNVMIDKYLDGFFDSMQSMKEFGNTFKSIRPAPIYR